MSRLKSILSFGRKHPIAALSIALGALGMAELGQNAHKLWLVHLGFGVTYVILLVPLMWGILRLLRWKPETDEDQKAPIVAVIILCFVFIVIVIPFHWDKVSSLKSESMTIPMPAPQPAAQAQINAGKTESEPDKSKVSEPSKQVPGTHKPPLNLKQRATSFANEFYGWVDKKDKDAPPLIIIDEGQHQVDNAYQMGRRSAYWAQVRDEYDTKNFGPRAMALKEEIAKCGIDVERRPGATNPLIFGNIGSARNNALLFRQFAVELPDSDKDLRCKK
jgi:hypothetical protein